MSGMATMFTVIGVVFFARAAFDLFRRISWDNGDGTISYRRGT